jgi:hypothetical protein
LPFAVHRYSGGDVVQNAMEAAMIDFLVEWMQALCILGLLCGAYYSITYRRDDAAARTPARQDPIAMHIREVTREATPHAHI